MEKSRTFTTWLRAFITRTTRFDSRFLLVLMTLSAIGVLWWQDRQRLEKRIVVLETRLNPKPFVGQSWGIEQVTGPPNTRTYGDQPTAWASQTQDGQPEWIEVQYAQSVKPFEIVVYETYNPGAITKVTAFDQFGNEGILWEGLDPSPPKPSIGVSTFKVKPSFATDRVRIYLASDKFPGWNEIDAIGLKYGWMGRTIWANKAQSSSIYGGGGGGGLGFFRSY